MLKMSLVVLAAVLAVQGGVALAAEKRSDEARRFYDEGTKYYALGEFAKAVENYKKAYEIKPDAVFLYNIAQAYRLGGDLNQALFFYKSYMRGMPNAPNKAEVQGRIKDIEATIATQKSTLSPPNDPVPPGTPGSATGSAPSTATVVDTTTGTGAAGTTSTGSGTTVPTPEEVARKSEGEVKPEVVVQGGGATQPTEKRHPFYTKWWFWTAVGVVVAGSAVAIVAASSGKSSPPSGDFGSVSVF